MLDMLQSAELIIQYTAEASKDDFIKNIQLQDSVIRRLFVIAEVETKHETQHSASKQIKVRYNNLTLVMIATGNSRTAANKCNLARLCYPRLIYASIKSCSSVLPSLYSAIACSKCLALARGFKR